MGSVDAPTDSLAETLSVFADAAPAGEPLTTSEVTGNLKCTRRAAYDRLQRLVDHGKLRTKKVGARGRVWWRPPAEPTAERAAESAAESTSGEGTSESASGEELPMADVLDRADVAVFVLNPAFELAWANSATERYFGLDRDAAVGRDKRRLVRERIAPTVADPDSFEETVLATYGDEASDEEFQCRVTAGEGREERWLEHRSRPIETGPLAGGRVELYYDVTDRVRTERDLRRERERFRSLVHAVEDYAIIMLDGDGRITSWNEGAARIVGYERSEIVGSNVETFYTVEDVEAGVPERIRSRAQTGAVRTDGWRVRKDGSRFWADTTITPVRRDGDLRGYAVVLHDRTEHRDRDRQLRRERHLVERILEASPVFIGVFDGDGELVRSNTVAAEALDLESNANYTVGDAPLFDSDGRALRPEETPVGRTLATGEPVVNEQLQIRRDGERRWHSVTTACLRGEDGEIELVAVCAEDITQHKEQARRLERQRDDLRKELDEVLERIDDAFYALDDEWRFTYVNERAATVMERSESELLGRRIWDVFPQAGRSDVRDRYEEAMDSQRSVSFQRYSTSLGVWLEGRVYPSESGLSVYFRDVTERKRSEEALAKSEKRFRAVFEEAFDAMLIANDDGECVAANPAACDLLGLSREEVLGRRIDEFVADRQDVDFEWNELKAGGTFQGTFPLRRDDGVERTIEYTATPSVLPGRHLAIMRDVTERIAQQRRLRRQHERLVAMNDLNDVVRGITDAVIEQSTREEIEWIVCDSLARRDAYKFALISEVDPRAGRVLPRVEAGVNGYLEDTVIPLDPDDPAGNGPASRAIRTKELHVSQNVFEDSTFEPFRERAREYGYRSTVSIPVVHGQTLYGIISVFTDREGGFAAEELTVLGQLGEIVGHAIASVERKRALMSDEVTEVEFSVPNIFGSFDVSPPDGGDIVFESTIPARGGTYLEYGVASADAFDAFAALVERVPHWEAATPLGQQGDQVRFELRAAEPPIVSIVATHGGKVERAAIVDGEYHVTMRLPPGVEIRPVLDAVCDVYPGAEMTTRRQVSRTTQSDDRLHRFFLDELTERQRAAIEAAYYLGFFEWPRDNSGQEVADTLDVAPPTFHQHLRRAEKKLLDVLFADRGGTDE